MCEAIFTSKGHCTGSFQELQRLIIIIEVHLGPTDSDDKVQGAINSKLHELK